MHFRRRETLTALGPSFIKAGQVLASRPDIIREDYMNELCILQVIAPANLQGLRLAHDMMCYIAHLFSSQGMHHHRLLSACYTA